MNRTSRLQTFIDSLGSYERGVLIVLRGALQAAVSDNAIPTSAAVNVRVRGRDKRKLAHIKDPKRALSAAE